MKLAILKNDCDESHLNWAIACQKHNIDHQIIDTVSDQWLNLIITGKFDGFLTCPTGSTNLFKELYDERIYIIEKVLGYFVYPNFNEISIHENKKYLSYWLKANKLNHPKTWVFYNLNEAVDFCENAVLPIVGKMNIGASGKGVKIFRDKQNLLNYVALAFTNGLRQDWGPNLKMGGYKHRIIKLLKDPSRIIKRLKIYKIHYNALQKGFTILQEYIEHDFEWRIVKIGDSYFGHRKIKQIDKASGTKGIEFTAPPDDLLFLVSDICSRFKFNTMSIDLFEDGKGGYLINEMQCIFGHVQSYICENEGKPGRFKLKENRWLFEEGLYNENLSYNLRVQHVKELLHLLKK